MNREVLFQAYKKEYEEYQKSGWKEDMDSDEWNLYVDECNRLYYQAAEVLLGGMSLNELYDLVKSR